MRCTRCDRVAVPQATGISPDGLVVFGWCLECLHNTRCTRIEAARGRPSGSRNSITPPRSKERSAGSDPTDRRRLATLVVGLLGVWSLVLAGAGVWLLANPRPNGPTPFGNGTPLFLLAGGGTAAAICGLLWCLTLGSGISRSHRALRGIRWALFVLALLILAAGIVRHAPRRDPFVVAAASVALGFSALAQRRERRFRYSGVVSHRFPTGEHGPSFSCGAGEPS